MWKYGEMITVCLSKSFPDIKIQILKDLENAKR